MVDEPAIRVEAGKNAILGPHSWTCLHGFANITESCVARLRAVSCILRCSANPARMMLHTGNAAKKPPVVLSDWPLVR